MELPGTRRRGRKPIGDKPMTAAERQLKRRITDGLLIASLGSCLVEAMAKVGTSSLDQAAKDSITADLVQAFDDLRALARADPARLPDGLAERPAAGERSEP